MNALSSATLYAPGAFFFYPWKPVAQLLVGDPYAVGYKFFRRDHSTTQNLALHLVALGWQLLGNFGLLACVDALPILAPFKTVYSARPVSALTAVLWSLMLLSSPAPMVCSLGSTAAIAGAYVLAPSIDPRVLEACAMAVFMLVLTVTSKPAQKVSKDFMHGCLRFGIAVAFRYAASLYRGQFAHASWVPQANVGVLALLVVLGMLRKPTVPCVLAGLVVARMVGEVTDQPWLLFYGQAFVAQLSQVSVGK